MQSNGSRGKDAKRAGTDSTDTRTGAERPEDAPATARILPLRRPAPVSLPSTPDDDPGPSAA